VNRNSSNATRGNERRTGIVFEFEFEQTVALRFQLSATPATSASASSLPQKPTQNLTQLLAQPRLLIEAELTPIAGTRFQPTGFPSCVRQVQQKGGSGKSWGKW
jgi:hypothetical protein